MSKKDISHQSKIVEFKKIGESKIPATTSLAISQVFEKRHDNVIREIETLIETGRFSRLNFEESTYSTERGKKYPMYLLDEKITTILIMGFTGERALDFKIKYQEEFVRMRSVVQRQKGDSSADLNKTLNAILEHSRLKQGKETKHFHYAALAKQINKDVFGDHKNEIRQEMTQQDQIKLNSAITKKCKEILKTI